MASETESFDVEPIRETLAALRHPETGCPWDKVQTFGSMAEAVLDEAAELAEALRSGDDAHVREEAGDLLWNLLTVLAIASDEKRFAPQSVVTEVVKKMVARHPHVFGDAEAGSVDEAVEVYRRAKEKQKRRDG